MARLPSLLGPLAKLVWRGLGSTAALERNHLALFTLFLCAMVPRSAVFLGMGIGLVLVFPLSADPLRRLPQERLQLFPMSPRERLRLRVLSLLLSPILWAVAALSLWSGRRYIGYSLTLLLLACLANLLSFLWGKGDNPIRQLSPLRRLPSLPGRLGGLVRKNLREMFQFLDPYAALVLAGTAAVYRFSSPRPAPEAMYGTTLMVALSLSTYAQRLFALDGRTGFERYALLPLRGWQVLLAKDLAFMIVLMILVGPLAPLPGLAAGLTLLAFGHRPSVLDPRSQPRWCFVSGASGGEGIVQVLGMFTASTLTFQSTPWTLVPCTALYLVSLFYFGWRLERRP